MGALLLLIARSQMSVKRSLSLGATILQIPLALILMSQAGEGLASMRAGNWVAAFRHRAGG